MRAVEELPVHWQRWYSEWSENVPDNDLRKRFQGELLGTDSRKIYSSAFELYLFSLFRAIGLDVEFQPTTSGVNADFLVSDKSHGLSQYAFVEAGVMYSDPLEELMNNQASADRIWKEVKSLKSADFQIRFAHALGNPGNVRGKEVRSRVQEWLNGQDASRMQDSQSKEYLLFSKFGILPRETFEFSDWKLEVELGLKSQQEKDKWDDSAITELAGFSGSWEDTPAKRLKSKLDQKFSQVRKTGKNCIVAITERMSWPSDGDVQQALWGANSGCLVDRTSDLLEVPKIKSDGLWSRNGVTQPMAVLVHSGNLRNENSGETTVWLNPNCSYFDIPLSLFSLKVCAAEQKIWVKPASHPGIL